jgi:HSP20 family protein
MTSSGKPVTGVQKSRRDDLEKKTPTLNFATLARFERATGICPLMSSIERSGAMSAVTRQDPWGVMPRLQDEINRLFGNARENDSSSATAMWIPTVDIHEYADRFVLYVDLPGVDPSKVDLTLDGGVLTLAGERQSVSKSTEEAQGLRVERGHGHFHRRFVLPDTVDSEKVNATGSHGVLTVTIPKQPKAMPRRIQIG